MKSRLYFDFTSPYSYLLWEKLLQVNFDFTETTMIPVVVGKIISDVGGVGPAGISVKRNYLFQDCIRKAYRHGIEFTSPGRLPFNPMDMLRFACALSQNKTKQVNFITSAFRYGWRDGRDYEDFSTFKTWIMEDCGITEQEYENYNNDKDARRALKSNIQEAVKAQVFGVPTISYNEMIFWGLDSLEDFFNSQKGLDPVNEQKKIYERFIKIVQGERND